MRRSSPVLPVVLGAAVMLLAAALACRSDTMRARDLPVWSCPTSFPLPTSTMQPGWETLTPPPATALASLTTTPYPSPTPYELMTDFPLSRHVRIGGVGGIGLGIWVWMDSVAVNGPFFVEDPNSGAETTRWVASWDVTVENASLTSDYEFYPFAQLYVLEVIEPDGLTHTSGAWGISGEAHELVGLPPPVLDESVTVFQPGEQRTVRVAALIPAPEVWRLGYVLDPLDTMDIEEMVQSHSIGSNVGVWINAYDLTCTTGEVTLAPGGAFAPVTYVPGFLLTRHPVMDGFWISRGFGCVDTSTGLLGTGCPADRPWFHNGVDYAITAGSPYYDTLPVAGSVTYAGVDEDGPDCSAEPGSLPPHTGYGNFVRHTAVVDGHEVVIWGAHLSGFNTSTGESTTPGQTLGTIGSTGCSTGAHLHFTVRVDGLYVDPLALIP